MKQEAFTPEGGKIFEHLHPDGFILGGGTGLALQIGHRISEDFDFFSGKEVAASLLGEMEEDLKELGLPLRPAVNNKDELTFFAGETKITFLYYPFPVLFPTVTVGGVSVFSIREIAAMKAYALGRRSTMKDYVDLYFILSGGESLESVVELAEKKYGDVFNTRLFLEQIIYLENLEEAPIRFLKEPVSRKKLQNFFEELVKKFPVP